MTVVLGRTTTKLAEQFDRALAGEPEDDRPASFQREWEARKRRYRAVMARNEYPTWQAMPSEPHRQPQMVPAGAVAPAPGLVDLYARRDARRPQRPAATGRISPHQRTVVGGRMDPTQSRRGCAVVGTTVQFGRGTAEHYTALHATCRPTYGRLRSGANLSVPRIPMGRRRMSMPPIPPTPGASLPSLRTVLRPLAVLSGAAFGGHGVAARRAILASITVLVLLASAASTTFAGQQRYEVHDGDTVESIAAIFGVDPDAIRSASYLPTGDDLESGQVLVIPEPGQDPSAAAEMAAEREGTSPWVETAHWVVEGDTLASIGAAYGVDPEQIAAFNAIGDPANLMIGSRVLIPYVVGNDPVWPGSGAGNQPTVAVDNVPAYRQSRNLSCEYAAAHIATSTFGDGVTEDAFMSAIPLASNPHLGYRGNIDGWWGNTDDYGIYAEALVPTLNEWGFGADVIYGDGSADALTANLDAGRPVMVWLGFWGETGEVLTDEGTYTVFAGMHVVTAYGYSDAGVWASDPAAGAYTFYAWDTFMPMWNVLDGMALAVYPM